MALSISFYKNKEKFLNGLKNQKVKENEVEIVRLSSKGTTLTLLTNSGTVFRVVVEDYLDEGLLAFVGNESACLIRAQTIKAVLF